MRTID